MKILSLAADASGLTHIALIRAPDLWRRDIAAHTGSAHLLFVALPPAGVPFDDVLSRLDHWLAKSGAEPATMARFANTPTRVVRVDPERVAGWLRDEIERASRPTGTLSRLLADIRRTCRRRVRHTIAAARGAIGWPFRTPSSPARSSRPLKGAL